MESAALGPWVLARLWSRPVLCLLLWVGVAAPAATQEPAPLPPGLEPQILQNPFFDTQQPPRADTATSPEVEEAAATRIKPLSEIRLNWRPTAARVPEDLSLELFHAAAPGLPLRSGWATRPYGWVAPTYAHKPLYWEDPWLERYGMTRRRWMQPWLSGGRFYLNFAAMPVKLMYLHPQQCVWSLGYWRPGDAIPCCPTPGCLAKCR